MSDYRINVRFHEDDDNEIRAGEYLKTLHRSRNHKRQSAVRLAVFCPCGQEEDVPGVLALQNVMCYIVGRIQIHIHQQGERGHENSRQSIYEKD